MIKGCALGVQNNESLLRLSVNEIVSTEIVSQLAMLANTIRTRIL